MVAVAEELHVGRAAERLGMTQPPLSRAIARLERNLDVRLLERHPLGVQLTAAGDVLLCEARATLDAAQAAARRTWRAAYGLDHVVLATKTGGSHGLLQALLAAWAADLDGVEVEVVFCSAGEQERLLLDGRADASLLTTPVSSLVGFDSRLLATEEQVAVVPAGHPLAARPSLTMAELEASGLPAARCPFADGTYPPGVGPQVHDHSELAHLVALGRAVAICPASARAWLWGEHAAVPLIDAPQVTTHIAWMPHNRSRAVCELVRTAVLLSRPSEGPLRSAAAAVPLPPERKAPGGETRADSAVA